MSGPVQLKLLWIAPKEGEYPFSPIAHVIPRDYSTANYKGICEDWPLLTHQCMGPNELDGEIDQLISDLEIIRKQGHRKFNEHHNKVRRQAES